MSFQQYVNEARKYDTAIFRYKEEHGSAKKFESMLWDFIEENEYVTIEDVSIEDTKYEDQFDFVIIAHFAVEEKQWKPFIEEIKRKFKIEFSNLA